LHVSDISRDEAFYRDVLGLELITRYPPAASFMGAGGYHHHIGINVWAGAGAPPPPEDAVGLRWYAIDLPSEDALEEVLYRLEEAGIKPEIHDDGLFVRDPAANGIVLRVSP
jgi:catechol 2,3-dioxygenase